MPTFPATAFGVYPKFMLIADRQLILTRNPRFLPPPPLKVSIVAMSGAVGEAMSYGTATGGATDLDNLGQIMNQTNPPMDGKEQQSQAR